MFIIRFAFYFTLSFGILCIPIGGGKQVFDKLFSMVTPYAKTAVETTKQKLSTTKRYSNKLKQLKISVPFGNCRNFNVRCGLVK